jgi:hypothetical protein
MPASSADKTYTTPFLGAANLENVTEDIEAMKTCLAVILKGKRHLVVFRHLATHVGEWRVQTMPTGVSPQADARFRHKPSLTMSLRAFLSIVRDIGAGEKACSRETGWCACCTGTAGRIVSSEARCRKAS